jgi:hypothetical protein
MEKSIVTQVVIGTILVLNCICVTKLIIIHFCLSSRRLGGKKSKSMSFPVAADKVISSALQYLRERGMIGRDLVSQRLTTSQLISPTLCTPHHILSNPL